MPKTTKKQQKKTTSILPIIMIGIGAVLFVAFLVWAAINSERQFNANASGENIPYPNIERVSLQDSKAAFDQKSAVFVDVRDAASYEASHIPGAINIPIDQIQSRANELDPNDWIITYCT